MTTEADTTETDVTRRTCSERTLLYVDAIAEIYAKGAKKTPASPYSIIGAVTEKGRADVEFTADGKKYLSDAIDWVRETKDKTIISDGRMNQPAWWIVRKINWLV